MKKLFIVSALIPCTLAVAGCSKHSTEVSQPAAADAPTTGAPAPAPAQPIAIDGSSTVFPINEAVAEEFQKTNGARVTVAASGTGGGFKKLCGKEIAIAGASRPIKPSETKLCAQNGVEYIELPVAYDGIAVTVNPQNTWLTALTVAELKKLWEPAAQGTVKTWADIREGFPKEEIHLFGAGVDSGTYDYFTKAIVGEEHKSRGDYQASEDDNVLVQGISSDKLALGFFGFGYYAENKDKLKLIAIDDGVADNGAGAIAPSVESIEKGSYQPLSRPLFIYVAKSAAQRPEVSEFVRYYLSQGGKLAAEVGYVALPAEVYALAQKRFTSGKAGSLFAGQGSKVGVTVAEVMKAE